MPFRGDPITLPPALPGASTWNIGSAAIAQTLKRSRMARGLVPSRRWGLTYEDVALRTTDGATLAAWYMPAPRTDLAVVLHHHYGGQRATLLPWLRLFVGLGLPCIAFDGRGHAASSPTPAGRGSFVHRGEDVRAALDWLTARGHDRVLGFGQSQGAAALLIGAARRPEVVGIVADCGPAPEMGSAAWGLAGNLLGGAAGADPWVRAALAARILPGTRPLLYAGALWRALWDHRRRPLLWVHGGRDDVIPESWSAVWYQALHTADWRRYRVPDAEHVRTLAVDPEGVRTAVAAFVETLATPPRTSDASAVF